MNIPIRNETRIPLLRILRSTTWSDWLGSLAVAFISSTLLVHLWNPLDSVPPVAAGESLIPIALAIVTGVFAAVAPSTFSRNNASEPDKFNKQSYPASAASWVWGAAAFFCAWLAIASVWTIGRGNTRYAINGFWQWTSLIVYAAAVSRLAQRPRFREQCWHLTFCVILGVLIYGFFDYAILQPTLRSQLQQNPDAMFEQQGVTPGSAKAILLRNRVESTEMHSVFALANSLAGFLVVAWSLSLGSILLRWAPGDAPPDDLNRPDDLHRQGRWIQLAEIAWLFIVALALLLTKSRTAWIAASLATVSLVGLHPLIRGRAIEVLKRSPKTCLLGLTGFAFATGAALALVYSWDPLIIREAGKSLAYRLDYWGGGSRLIAEEPIRGFGPLQFQSTYLRVKLPTAAESPADPHNFLLEIAHAGGIPLLLAAILVGLLGIRFTVQRLVRETAITPQPDASIDLTRGQSSTEIKSTVDGWAFWGSAAITALGFFAWSFLTAGDLELVATITVITVGFVAAIIACRSRALVTRAQRFARHGSYAIGVALMAFMVHLLASGGWMLPGTMILPMLLAGLLLCDGTEDNPPLTNRESPTRDPAMHNATVRNATVHNATVHNATVHNATVHNANFYKTKWLLGLGASILLVLWCSTMAWPLMRSAEASQRLSQWMVSGSSGDLGNTGGAMTPRVVGDLVSADRWDPELPRVGMELCTRQLLGTVPRFLGASPRSLGSPSLGAGTLGDSARREWEEAMLAMHSEFLSRDPRHALAYGECGRAALRLASGEKTPEGRKRWLDLANEDFGRGAEVFTASVEAQLQAAVASFLAGDDERAKRFCRRAIEIDGITPHADRKIKAAEIFWPKNLENPTSTPTESRLRTNQDLVRGEPVLATLRKSLSL